MANFVISAQHRSTCSRRWPTPVELDLVKNIDPAKLSFHAQPEPVAERADFIQESVPERIEIKHEMFGRIEPYLKPDAIIASSTSGLMGREMQKGIDEAEPNL